MFDGPVNAEEKAAGVQIPAGTTLKLTFSTTGVIIPSTLAQGDKVGVYWARSPATSLPKEGWMSWKIEGATGQLMAFEATKGLLHDPQGAGRWNFIPLVVEKRPNEGRAKDPTEVSTTGPAFKAITIGPQQWMVDNLAVTCFRNGDSIPEAKTSEEWLAAYRSESPAWCTYNNDPKSGETLGRLYNWYAVNDPRGLSPAGWHVPTEAEWAELIKSCGGMSTAFEQLRKPDGFNARAAGARWFKDASFNNVGKITFWWTANKKDKWNAAYYAMHFGLKQVATDSGGMNTGHSVRCVKDKEPPEKH